MSDDEIWTVAAFFEHIDSLPPEVNQAWSRNSVNPSRITHELIPPNPKELVIT